MRALAFTREPLKKLRGDSASNQANDVNLGIKLSATFILVPIWYYSRKHCYTWLSTIHCPETTITTFNFVTQPHLLFYFVRKRHWPLLKPTGLLNNRNIFSTALGSFSPLDNGTMSRAQFSDTVVNVLFSFINPAMSITFCCVIFNGN